MPEYDLKFYNMSDAFDFCREANRPVRVWVNNELYKLFPSGSAEKVGERDKLGNLADLIYDTLMCNFEIGKSIPFPVDRVQESELYCESGYMYFQIDGQVYKLELTLAEESLWERETGAEARRYY